MKIAVLGCGMVGSLMADELANKYDVTAFDLKNLYLEKKYKFETADLSNLETIDEICRKYDLIVGAVPGYMGFNTCKRVIENGKNIVDISFFPEDCFELDELAKEKGVCVVVDCGVAPGMGNILLGKHNQSMKVHSFECYVGGLPVERCYPFEYKAPFSPIDVLEEYTRPARIKIDNTIVSKEALSEPELLYFGNIGHLEAFNTDGLRSLIYTMPNVPNLKEKTLRYPGHIKLMEIFRSLGFFSQDKIEIDGNEVCPLSFTSKLLFDNWKLTENDIEFTAMRIIIKGLEDDMERTYQYDLLDYRDTETGNSSMARTTGYTATAVVELLINGDFDRKGVNPPEFIGAKAGCAIKVLDYLKERNVVYSRTTL